VGAVSVHQLFALSICIPRRFIAKTLAQDVTVVEHINIQLVFLQHMGISCLGKL